MSSPLMSPLGFIHLKLSVYLLLTSLGRIEC